MPEAPADKELAHHGESKHAPDARQDLEGKAMSWVINFFGSINNTQYQAPTSSPESSKSDTKGSDNPDVGSSGWQPTLNTTFITTIAMLMVFTLFRVAASQATHRSSGPQAATSTAHIPKIESLRGETFQTQT